jgi:hypothetical protein
MHTASKLIFGLKTQIAIKSFECPVTGQYRAVYLTLPDGNPDLRVRTIGKCLYRMGGVELMRSIESWISDSGDKRELDYAWDGIGEWRC